MKKIYLRVIKEPHWRGDEGHLFEGNLHIGDTTWVYSKDIDSMNVKDTYLIESNYNVIVRFSAL